MSRYPKPRIVDREHYESIATVSIHPSSVNDSTTVTVVAKLTARFATIEEAAEFARHVKGKCYIVPRHQPAPSEGAEWS